MDLRQLRHFLQIADAGSFSAAAHILHIAQPALSRQMRTLESDLGVRLFHRTGRGVVLTEAGRALIGEARDILDRAEQARRLIRGFGTTISGEATIGLSPTLGRVLSLRLATQVQAQFPQVKLRIVEAFSGTLLEWLQAGRVDAAVLYQFPVSAALRSERVAEEPLAVVGAAENPRFPPGTAMSITALAGVPLVLSTPHHGLRAMIEKHAAAAGVRLQLLFEFDSLEPTIAVVKQGMALTILPQAAVRSEVEAGTLVAWPIANPELIRPLIVATASQRAEAIPTRALAALLRGVIETAAPDFGWQLPYP